MALNAAAPPPSLSEAICETANDGSLTRGVDQDDLDLLADARPCSGACMAETSVGAIRIASGLLATTESTIGFCSVGSNLAGPCVLTVGAHLLGLGLDAALHGDVELVAGDALDEAELLGAGCWSAPERLSPPPQALRARATLHDDGSGTSLVVVFMVCFLRGVGSCAPVAPSR